MLKYHDVEQNSDDWFQLRSGKLTSSKLACVMANYEKPFGEPARDYAVDLAIEQITGMPVPSSYSNSFMEAGHDLEIQARIEYEAQTFSHVDNGGFFGGVFIGCSPDGRVGENGIIEIKSVTKKARTHFERVRKGGIPSEHKWQCIGNLKWTGADWLDFISYCSWYPEGKQLFIVRLHREDCLDQFDMIDARVEAFRHLVNTMRVQIENGEYSK